MFSLGDKVGRHGDTDPSPVAIGHSEQVDTAERILADSRDLGETLETIGHIGYVALLFGEAQRLQLELDCFVERALVPRDRAQPVNRDQPAIGIGPLRDRCDAFLEQAPGLAQIALDTGDLTQVAEGIAHARPITELEGALQVLFGITSGDVEVAATEVGVSQAAKLARDPVPVTDVEAQTERFLMPRSRLVPM